MADGRFFLERDGLPAICLHWENHDYLGMGPGFAGLGHLWFAFHEVTGEEAWVDLMHRTAERLIQHAEPDRGHLNWRRKLDDPTIERCHWCHGGAGIGQFFARTYERTEESRYLDVAVAAGECTYAYGDDRHNPSQCHGLAGKAELFVELFQVTGERKWHDRVVEFVELMLAYRHNTAAGERWQADEPDLYSPDFMCGAAGVGHFFLRVLDPGLRLPLL